MAVAILISFNRMNLPRHFALIPAAGVGARMGADCPKQYLRLCGRQILRHVLDTFAVTTAIAHTYVVVSPDDAYIDEALAGADDFSKRATVIRDGGDTRQQSVLNGLRAMRPQVADHDWVLVHDAARPGLTAALIERLIDTLREDEVGGLLALPVVDTLKRGGADGRVEATVSREALWAAQTPQMFRYSLLQRALQLAGTVTDEAGAVEMLGLKPKLVEGSPRNFKITLPHDLALAELHLKGHS